MNKSLPDRLNTSISSLYSTKGKDTSSGLIFCPHVNGEFGVVDVSKKISESLTISSSFYSGGRPKYWKDPFTYNSFKKKIARNFKYNRIPILVSTKAFGMGIDKPNIRYTIHYGIPPSIESFYQEAGRAGRDRSKSVCCIIVSNDDVDRTQKLLDPNTEVEEIASTLNTLYKQGINDDITRALFFHIESFKGIKEEINDAKIIIEKIGDTSNKKKITILSNENGLNRTTAEKSIHRLLLIGVIDDYTINYSSNEISILLSGADKNEIIKKYGKYIFGFIGQKRKQVEETKAREYINLDYRDFLLKIFNLLLDFIYNNIEKGRRHALQEIWLCTQNNNFREYMLDYLGRGDSSTKKIIETLENILHSEDVGISEIQEIIENIQSPREAAEIRGNISRNLESYPDQPALLIGRALSEIFTSNYSSEIIEQNLFASFSSAINNYGLDREIIADLVWWSIFKISDRDLFLSENLLLKFISLYPDRDYSLILIDKLPLDLCHIPAINLIKQINVKINTILTKGA